MSHKVFRIANLAWAAIMGVFFALRLEDPTHPDQAAAIFWGVYILASIGIFFDLRTAWLLCAVQLLTIWVLMGGLVSERSFSFFTGEDLFQRPSSTVHMVVFNSFFGIIAPASGLLITLFFARGHLIWVFRRRRPRRARRRTVPSEPVDVWQIERSSR